MALKWGLPFRAAAIMQSLTIDHPDLLTSVKRLSSPHFHVIGLDTASRAVAYAASLGLIDEAIITDINAEDLHDSETSTLEAGVDYVLASGVFSYVRAGGFDRLLRAMTFNPGFTFVGWPLAGEDVSDVLDVLSDHGLVVEHSTNQLWPQRMYSNQFEQKTYRELALKQGIDFTDTLAERYLCVTQMVATLDHK